MLNNEVSAIDSCKQKPIIDHIIELTNQWLPEVATRTLIGALRFCRAWSVYLLHGDHALLKETSARGRDIVALVVTRHVWNRWIRLEEMY